MSESVCFKKKLTVDKEASGMGLSAYVIRECTEGDVNELGELYFESYDSGIACSSLSESIDDIANSFKGEYGPFSKKCSLALVDKNNKSIVAAILVVKQNSWDESIKCPYIIELFVQRKFRRKGYAKKLIIESMNRAMDNKANEVALTVDLNNKPALNLYKSLGFRAQP